MMLGLFDGNQARPECPVFNPFKSECWADLWGDLPGTTANAPAPVLQTGWSEGCVDADGNADPNCSSNIIKNINTSVQNQVNAVPCPWASDANGNCCAEGQVVNTAGQCSTPASSISWWIWAAVAGGVLLLLEWPSKGRSN